MEPISESNSFARSTTSAGKASFARFISSGYSVKAATCNIGLRKSRWAEDRKRETNLSSEGDRWLIEALLLGVPDVGGHDFGERQ